MRKAVVLFLLFAFLSGCTTYDGAAYIKTDLARMECGIKPAQKSVDIKTAKADCIKDIVDEEFFKGGASWVTVDSIRDVNRWRYSTCMGEKGFFCSWGPESK